MDKELSLSNQVAGLKQSQRAIREGKAVLVYVAADADPTLVEPVLTLCRTHHVPVEQALRMAQLGRACGLSVGAAVAAVLK